MVCVRKSYLSWDQGSPPIVERERSIVVVARSVLAVARLASISAEILPVVGRVPGRSRSLAETVAFPLVRSTRTRAATPLKIRPEAIGAPGIESSSKCDPPRVYFQRHSRRDLSTSQRQANDPAVRLRAKRAVKLACTSFVGASNSEAPISLVFFSYV